MANDKLPPGANESNVVRFTDPGREMATAPAPISQNNKPLIGTTKWKPCPNGHPFPEEHHDGHGNIVIMCRVEECGWCAPHYSWNLRHRA